MIASSPDSARNIYSIIRDGIIAICVLGVVSPLDGQANGSNSAHPAIFQRDKSTTDGKQVTPLATLITEALQNNPEIQASLREHEAAQQRISPAEALDDPMLEAGVINAPLASSPFNRDDMTMKMIGLSQRFPFPGKRSLRKEVASKDAEASNYGYQETVNRVVRDLKVAYFDLGLAVEMTRLVEKNKLILEHFLQIAEGRYQVGEGSQADVLKAQTQVSRMQDELLRLARERPVIEAELIRVLGRGAHAGGLIPESLHMHQTSLNLESLREEAMRQRPQLLALQSLTARNKKAVELAQKEYYPDFDVRLSYGQRDRMLDNTSRPDMVSLTVAVNLPIWRNSKIEPRIAESQAMYHQALDLYQVQTNEIAAKLRQQGATAEQNFKSVQLYQTTILPQARLTVESALAAYRVNQVDFLTLLDSQMTVFNYEIGLVTAMANYNRALTEIDLLTGKTPAELVHPH